MPTAALEVHEIIRGTAHGFCERTEKTKPRITASAFDLCEYGQRNTGAGRYFLLCQACGHAPGPEISAECGQDIGFGFGAVAIHGTPCNVVGQARRRRATHP